jgi:parallel beta-helix repeat protein
MTGHRPIVVHNNTDLAGLIALNDWPGDGSSAHPYLIGNLEINATGFTNAISIGNTSSYLIITNSHITNASSQSAGFGCGAGISLFNTSNVRIVNNTIGGCRYGIVLRNSTLTTVCNNTIARCSSFGMVSNGSSGNHFHLNAFIGNNAAGSAYDLVHAQAYEDGTGDLWSYGSLGNYWSDLTPIDNDHDSIIDSAYFLAGPGNASDALPLAATVASPHGLQAAVGQGSVYLTWTAPSYAIGPPVTGLTLYRVSSTGDDAVIPLSANDHS